VTAGRVPPRSEFHLAIQHVLVLGGGSAGFLAALTVKTRRPHLDVTVLRSPEIGIIGVGEGSTPALTTHLHGYLGIPPRDFYAEADPTWKLGIRFLWGPRPFFDYTFTPTFDWKWDRLSRMSGYYCRDDVTDASITSALMSVDKAFPRQANGDPLVGRDVAYHIANEKFVGFFERRAARFGVVIREGTVAEVLRDESRIKGVRLATGEEMSADLFVDCSGFRSLLLGKTLAEPFRSFRTTLFCDRAVTGGWDRTTEPIQPYTTAETMTTGWCWRIDHPTRIMRGYVYSSAFISDEDAEKEFRAKCPLIDKTWVVKFPPGRYERSWVQNVVAIGNASGFVEPLEATSLAVICDESRLLAEVLRESADNPPAAMADRYNGATARYWDAIRNFLSVHYKLNTRLDTPFWIACRADVELSPQTAELLQFYRACGPTTFARMGLLPADDTFGMEGYLSMFVGQAVPYEMEVLLPADEIAVWDEIRAGHRARAATGLSVAEALAVVRSPNWQWRPDFYSRPNL
jgi:tryptophan 7-halogenase